MKILLVCSSGGHFSSMMRLRSFWERHECIWVTFHSSGAENTLAGEKVIWAHSPTNRNLPNLVRNLLLAFAIMYKEKPDLVLSTGAGVAVPFMLLAWIFRCQAAFVESLTRTRTLSLSGRLVLPFVTVYVQWPQLQEQYPKTVYAGTIYAGTGT